jgi:hypothetical protein
MTPLCDIAQRQGTNKADEGYTPFYYELFKGRDVTRVLELGIGGPGLSGGVSAWGASLYMWAEFFDHAEIYGADIDPMLLINRGRITSYQVDVTNADSLRALGERSGGDFDVIIDDAVHLPGPQILACQTLLPFLAGDGVYIIEDVANCPPSHIISQLPDGFIGYSVQCKNWPLVVVFPY